MDSRLEIVSLETTCVQPLRYYRRKMWVKIAFAAMIVYKAVKVAFALAS